MSIEKGHYDKHPSEVDHLNKLDWGIDTGLIVERSGDAWLISELDVDDIDEEPISTSALNNSSGRFRLHIDDPDIDGLQFTDQIYDDFRMARLAYGLWSRCGPFNHPEGHAVPVEVATDSQAAIAAYLQVGNGYPNSRDYVADKMDVTKQTVSNYCQKIRYDLDDKQEMIQIP
jgi:hypothetical protein